MAGINIPDVLVYLTTIDGATYYIASRNANGVYSVSTTTTPTPIMHLPKGWDDADVTYKRHPQYLGVFRSESEPFTFVKDARAILLDLMYREGGFTEAQCRMRIDVFGDVRTGYTTAYASEINFSDIQDAANNNDTTGLGGIPNREGNLTANTLDSKLYRDLEAFGDTVFNIPIWRNDGTVDAPSWVTDADFVVHDGIKLLYSATYASGATVGNPLKYADSDLAVGGFKNGFPGGAHTILNLEQYNIVQNNGTTTYIGNDILQPYLIQGNQQNSVGASSLGEGSFSGIDNSRPYTQSNYSIKNSLLCVPADMDVWISMEAQIKDAEFFYSTEITDTAIHFSFVVFEIGVGDSVTSGVDGNYTPVCEIYRIDLAPNPPPATHVILPGGGYINTQSNPAILSMKYDKVYMICMIYDGLRGSEPFHADTSSGCIFTNLQFSIFSRSDSGVGGSPIPAPKLNTSVFPALTLKKTLQKIVPYLGTTNSDLYGFPIPDPAIHYSGESDFLASTTPIADCAPAQIRLTSAYCIHDLQGQSYISLSFNKLYDFCNKVLGCGAGVNLADPNKLEIERISHYFDKDTKILDLGENVSGLQIKPFKDLSGCNLILGYSKADTNSDFGVDAFNTELFFNTPARNLPMQDINWQETSIITEQYAIEKIRAQRVSQPIGEGYNPASPSGDNQTVALYCMPATHVVLPNADATSPYDIVPIDPSNTPVPSSAYQLTQRTGLPIFGSGGYIYSPCAQSTDPAAASQPYVLGMYYPDTAINLELSPCRALGRDGGALLHSVLDSMEEKDLVFRSTAVMQYNNTPLPLGGIRSNLNVGSGAAGVINEFSDKQINGLPAKLFRPYIFEFETVAPVNMYATMNTNANGYIQFTWKGVVFKGFIWSIVQKLTLSRPTRFELIAHPETTNEMLKGV